MGNKSRKECVAIAAPIIKKNKIEKMYVTSDGQAFFEDNRAYLHKANMNDKVEVYKIEASEVGVEEDSEEGGVDLLKASVKKIKETVQSVNDITFLQEAISIENATEKPRKTVVKIIEDRITELQNTLPVNDSEEVDTTQNNEEE